jgi:glutathione S-transferase
MAALETQVPEVAAVNRARADASLALFEAQLGQTEWIAADRITMADGVLYTGLEFARIVRFKIPDTMPNLTRWLAAIRARPSAKAGA